MKITLAQLNPIVGDVKGNLARLQQECVVAAQAKSDLIIFSELYLTGYPPRDLLNRPWFLDVVDTALQQIATLSAQFPYMGILVGAPVRDEKRTLYNTAALFFKGTQQALCHKLLLPTYDIFDEARYFTAAEEITVIPFKDEMLGITVCEDAWNDQEFWPEPRYARDPVAELAAQGATLLINIAASPFHVGKEKLRSEILAAHAVKHQLSMVFVNQVGGNDELIFDGRSMVFNAKGEHVCILPACVPAVESIVLETAHAVSFVPRKSIASVYDALVLGVQDYLRKCGFKQALLGLSGGIDSAVTAVIAADALGAENVTCVTMPGPYSSPGSVNHSVELAHNLGSPLKNISIKGIYTSFIDALNTHFTDTGSDIAEQNIQARARGSILMGLSNKFGSIVLTTGNKSELAVGYCTLYGDMNGGLAVISDVPKMMVYELAEYINRDKEVIPREIITKPPSAELRPDQCDQDSLPPYAVLDAIIMQYVQQNCSPQEIIATGIDPEVVQWVITTIDRNEYKRRQAAPGLRITSKAFGMGRRKPIAARYEH